MPNTTAALLKALPTAVIGVSTEGTVTYANGRAERLLGAQLLDRQIDVVLAPLDQIRVAADLGERRQVSVQRIGSHLALGFQCARSDDGWVVVFQDITDLQRLRQERDRLLQLAAVGEVLPALLHELKNPLAATSSALEVLIEEHADQPIAEELHPVLTEVRRISLTLDGVGRLSQSLYSRQPAAIDHCCREAFEVLAVQGQQKGVVMSTSIPTLPLLPLDAGSMRALVFNLVMNAIHACKKGDRIELSLRMTGCALVLTVKDSGAGMTPEVLARCREIFFTTKARGSGIGLALCQSLVESIAGTLIIDSKPGEGTTVTAELPLQEPPSFRRD